MVWQLRDYGIAPARQRRLTNVRLASAARRARLVGLYYGVCGSTRSCTSSHLSRSRFSGPL
jgi:hypothetical protein